MVLIILSQLSQFFPFCACPHSSPLPSSNPPISSCPWVMCVSSLASPFPILFFRSCCLFCPYKLCFLILLLFPPYSPFPFQADNPPCDLHFYDSVSVLVVCLVCFCFLDSVVDSCESVVIFLFIVLIFFFFLNKSL